MSSSSASRGYRVGGVIGAFPNLFVTPQEVDHMNKRSPAQVYALVIGIVLVAAGILGFFYEASFSTGDDTLTDRDAVLGILDVNGWHNLVHILSGVGGLAVAGSLTNARHAALGIGGVRIHV